MHLYLKWAQFTHIRLPSTQLVYSTAIQIITAMVMVIADIKLSQSFEAKKSLK